MRNPPAGDSTTGGDPATRLVVYGSLAPGEANHHILAALKGEWVPCTIRGFFGTHAGYRTFTPAADGPEHDALLFASASLPDAWPQLDEFEGDDYERVLIAARVGDRDVLANVYARNLRTAGEIRS